MTLKFTDYSNFIFMTRNSRLNYLGAGISIFVNLILFVLKYWVGIVSNSVAMMADAWHTLSDAFTSGIVIAGTKLSSRKPDLKHPFGHGRYEQIAAIFIGVLLAVVAYEFIIDAITRLSAREKAVFGNLAIIVTIISIFTKEAMAQMSFYIARRTGNSSMKADAWHHRSDALSSIIVLVGISLQNKIWWIDAVLGIIVSLILAYAVFEIFKDTISKLIGEEIPEETKENVKQIITNLYGYDFEAHHFHIHNYGNHKELTFHIYVNPDLSVHDSHEIATKIQKEILKELNICTTIHIEPKGLVHNK